MTDHTHQSSVHARFVIQHEESSLRDKISYLKIRMLKEK